MSGFDDAPPPPKYDTLLNTSNIAMFLAAPPPTAITISTSKGTLTLSWSNGVVTITGTAPVDEAAKVFLTAVGIEAISHPCNEPPR